MRASRWRRTETVRASAGQFEPLRASPERRTLYAMTRELDGWGFSDVTGWYPRRDPIRGFWSDPDGGEIVAFGVGGEKFTTPIQPADLELLGRHVGEVRKLEGPVWRIEPGGMPSVIFVR